MSMMDTVVNTLDGMDGSMCGVLIMVKLPKKSLDVTSLFLSADAEHAGCQGEEDTGRQGHGDAGGEGWDEDGGREGDGGNEQQHEQQEQYVWGRGGACIIYPFYFYHLFLMLLPNLLKEKVAQKYILEYDLWKVWETGRSDLKTTLKCLWCALFVYFLPVLLFMNLNVLFTLSSLLCTF